MTFQHLFRSILALTFFISQFILKRTNFKKAGAVIKYFGQSASNPHLRFAARYRPIRMRKMKEYFAITEETTILDVGGNQLNWVYLDVKPKVTILNLRPRPKSLPSNYEYIIGDARSMSFATNSFDLCHSSSVIEHVGDWENKQRVADEIRRVGRSYYVQTPNYYFFIEPHFIAPFIHWLPVPLRIKLIRYFTLWGLTTRPDQAEIECAVRETDLLTKGEMKKLFPEADFLNERVLGMQKSLISAFNGESLTPEAKSMNRHL